MSKPAHSLLACTILTLAASGATAGSRLSDLAWLAGNWKGEARSGTAYESWTRLGDRTFEGRAYTKGADGKQRGFEDLRLLEMAGEVFYVSKVAENPFPVAFRLTSLEGRTAVFENPTHDFPTRITYALREDGSLLAFIEGPGGPDGKLRRIDYVFVRD